MGFQRRLWSRAGPGRSEREANCRVTGDGPQCVVRRSRARDALRPTGHNEAAATMNRYPARGTLLPEVYVKPPQSRWLVGHATQPPRWSSQSNLYRHSKEYHPPTFPEPHYLGCRLEPRHRRRSVAGEPLDPPTISPFCVPIPSYSS